MSQLANTEQNSGCRGLSVKTSEMEAVWQVVMASDLKSSGPGFKSRSDR